MRIQIKSKRCKAMVYFITLTALTNIHNSKTGNICMYTVTLWRVRANTLAVEYNNAVYVCHYFWFTCAVNNIKNTEWFTTMTCGKLMSPATIQNICTRFFFKEIVFQSMCNFYTLHIKTALKGKNVLCSWVSSGIEFG